MTDALSAPHSPVADLPFRRAAMYVVLIAAAMFAAMAPTLRWPEFTGGNENIVVQTALEIRRGGNWLLPTMLGEPRVKKPPLVAWITAAAMRPSTLAVIDDPTTDDATREAAYRDLAWQVRWTGLLAAALTVLATFALARLIVGNRLGVIAAASAGTMLLFQRYMRQSTTDVHLALWVTVANAALAHGLLRGRWLGATLTASVALGIAFLCKGPVALVQTLAPALVFWLLPTPRDAQSRENNSSGGGGAQEGALLIAGARSFPASPEAKKIAGWKFILIGIAIFATIAVPWFAYVATKVPNVADVWFVEVNREGATDLEASSPTNYLLWLPLSWPWMVFVVVGFILLAKHFRQKPALLLPALQIVVPLAVMAMFRDRKERYTLPMVAPVAVLAAAGVGVFWQMVRQRLAGARWISVIHWALLLGAVIALPLAAALHPDMRTIDGGPWYALPTAIVIAAALALMVVVGIVLQKRSAVSIVVTSFIAMLALQAVFQYGYARSASGRAQLRPIAEAIRRQVPTAEVYDFVDGMRVDEELAIYLNRPIIRADPTTLSASRRPQVYITRQHRRQIAAGQDPVPPPGWHVLIVAPERRNKWWAFVRPPSTD